MHRWSVGGTGRRSGARDGASRQATDAASDPTTTATATANATATAAADVAPADGDGVNISEEDVSEAVMAASVTH